MPTHAKLIAVTDRIRKRSAKTRAQYLERMAIAGGNGPKRAHLSCSNQAHAYAAMGPEKPALTGNTAPNLGIITAYNDMLSAHKPFENYPEIIRAAAHKAGGTAQVAGGVPAMCDGVTQGQAGMELSLFSRDVIALSAAIGLSHDCFDAVVYLGVCDKIVPGLVIAAATYGHLPGVFLPAGPMTSGLPNDEKARIRQKFATGEVGREVLMQAEMQSYHGPGTCTFYGTANSNQMLMEFMGLHLPGASFVPPETDLRAALTAQGAIRAIELSAMRGNYLPVCDILDEKAFVNGMVGLMATGGSTNLLLHLPAMARAAGIILDIQDFAELSEITPLLARVYPNGLADVNHFHAAGGLGYMIGELLDAGLLHEEVKTVAGTGLSGYVSDPFLQDGALQFRQSQRRSLNDKILRPVANPFQPEGGLKELCGNLGRAVIKVSAISPDRHIIEAPARVFDSQDAVKAAFRAGEFSTDTIVVVRFQGPRANGMPELHALTPVLAVLQDRGLKVALVTDGRMSGASGKVPAAIHLSPEAAEGGPLACLRDGDTIRLDAVAGTLDILNTDLSDRTPEQPDLQENRQGHGRELFEIFRKNAGPATLGADSILPGGHQ